MKIVRILPFKPILLKSGLAQSYQDNLAHTFNKKYIKLARILR